MATSPLPSQGPKRGRNCYVTLAFSGVPITKRTDKIRSGYLTPAFLGVQKRALLRNPCILGGPHRQAHDLTKQLVAELRAACQLNPNLGAKPKSSDTKADLIYKHAFCNYL